MRAYRPLKFKQVSRATVAIRNEQLSFERENGWLFVSSH